MKAFTLRSQFYFPSHTNLTRPPAINPQSLVPTSHLKHQSKYPLPLLPLKSPTHPKKDQIMNYPAKTKLEELVAVRANGYWRYVILGSVSVGLAVFVMGMEEHKALALGPEGPLMEEFWDNMRRYGLYILTVSSGVLYAVFQPIVELLKNPISAILVLTIFGGGFYIVSQVVSAMVGVSDFAYDYNY